MPDQFARSKSNANAKLKIGHRPKIEQSDPAKAQACIELVAAGVPRREIARRLQTSPLTPGELIRRNPDAYGHAKAALARQWLTLSGDALNRIDLDELTSMQRAIVAGIGSDKVDVLTRSPATPATQINVIVDAGARLADVSARLARLTQSPTNAVDVQELPDAKGRGGAGGAGGVDVTHGSLSPEIPKKVGLTPGIASELPKKVESTSGRVDDVQGNEKACGSGGVENGGGVDAGVFHSHSGPGEEDDQPNYQDFY